MTDQAKSVFTKEYLVNNGVIVIENIFSQNKTKTDIIKEVIANTACLDSKYLVQSACRNMDNYGSQAKGETN